VAERLGGSKATLYRYFSSKDDLFVALMFDAVLEDAEAVFDSLQPSDNLRRTLVRFGARLLALNLSETSLAVRRNSIAEGSRSGIGALLYERGAKVLWTRMADFLGGEMAAGRLRPEDPWMVAMHLRGMLEADVLNRALIGAPVDTRPKCLRAHAERAVEALLRAYGQLSGGQVSDPRSARATPPSTGMVAPTT
jgi:AcrR family transcriptional regulator